MGAVAFAASWLRQTGRRRVAIGLVVALFVVGAGISAALIGLAPGKRKPDPLTSAEKAPLVVVDEGGQRRLRHPALGFSILHPGPGFRESAEVTAAIRRAGDDPETHAYGFMDPDSRSTLVIALMKGMGGSRAALSEHLDGLQRGMAGSVGSTELRWVGKQVTWDDRRRVGRLSALVAGTVHVEVAAYALESPGRPPFIVNLTMSAADADRPAAVLASFRP
jgi:hypothetical protein